MSEIEKEIRVRLAYLLNDNSRYEIETNIPDTIGEQLDRQIIPTWLDEQIEKAMLEYIKNHPKATLCELEEYEISLLPPLKIVDDNKPDY